MAHKINAAAATRCLAANRWLTEKLAVQLLQTKSDRILKAKTAERQFILQLRTNTERTMALSYHTEEVAHETNSMWSHEKNMKKAAKSVLEVSNCRQVLYFNRKIQWTNEKRVLQKTIRNSFSQLTHFQT